VCGCRSVANLQLSIISTNHREACLHISNQTKCVTAYRCNKGCLVYILICLLCTHAELAQFSLSAVVAAPSCSRHKLSHRTMAQHADLGLAVHSDRNKPTGSDSNVIGVAPSQDRFRFHFSLAHVTYLFTGNLQPHDMKCNAVSCEFSKASFQPK
jgi:hypothetical protein